MTGESQQFVRCGICLVRKSPDEMQLLGCKHTFCGLCLSVYTGSFCPAERCEGDRSTDIVIDEMADQETAARIQLGTHTASMLEIEEKLKCDGRKGALACMNVARMSLTHCRHSYCYDCLVRKLQRSLESKAIPTCPLSFCANRILKAEVRQLSLCYPLAASLCTQISALLPADPSPTPAPLKDEEFHVVDCSIYGKEASVKRIIIPKACIISDMLSAILQLQKLGKNRTASSLGVYIRHDEAGHGGPVKYLQIRPKLLGKKLVKEMAWPDVFPVVVDLDGSLDKKK